jgi:putative sterol carrier protein
MAQVNTGSDLLETLLSSAEKNTAMQFQDTNLAVMYLTNSRIAIMRQLAEQEFTDPNKDGENQRIRAYLKGQYDLLGALIEGALHPDPVVESDQSPSNSPGA